jgi:hypothetical protein
MDPLIDLLDRQVFALAAHERPVDFLVSVAPFLRALAAEPRIAVHLGDLRDETVEHVRVLEKLDDELLPALIDLRQRVAAIERSTEQAGPTVSPPDNDPDSLANFDAIAAAPPAPLNYKAEGARAAQLLTILQSQASAISSESPTAEQWKVDLWNVQQRWDHASRWLRLEMRVSAGLALLRLDAIPPALNPDPIFRRVDEDQRAHLERLLFRNISTEGQLFTAVHAGGLSPAHESFVQDRVDELRAALGLLSTELHRRIGTSRSRQALISRFKQRAEWHDAERLRAVADQRDLGATPRIG